MTGKYNSAVAIATARTGCHVLVALANRDLDISDMSSRHLTTRAENTAPIEQQPSTTSQIMLGDSPRYCESLLGPPLSRLIPPWLAGFQRMTLK
jgi:hypothetical protein